MSVKYNAYGGCKQISFLFMLTCLDQHREVMADRVI